MCDSDPIDYEDDIHGVLDYLDDRFNGDLTEGLTLRESVEAGLSAVLDDLMNAYAEFLRDLRLVERFTTAALLLCQEEALRRGWGSEGPES